MKKIVAPLIAATQTNSSGVVSTSSQYATGMTITATSRTRSQPIRVRRLSHRSTRTPATGPSSGMPRYCAMATMPTSSADASRAKIIRVGTTKIVILSPTMLTD